MPKRTEAYLARAALSRLVTVEPGAIFGRLTVSRIAPSTPRGERQWECLCSCGKTTVVTKARLSHSITRSCGCLHRETAAQIKLKHGASRSGARTPEFVVWHSAKSRCCNPQTTGYADYGGRGITMAPEFLNDFAAFFAEVGPRPTPKHTIERIDNERGYEPGNLRWATRAEQGHNRRNTRFTWEDIRHIRSLKGSKNNKEIADQYGVATCTIWQIQHRWIWKE